MNEPTIKKMFFVSTGRCGTTRIAEILRQHVPQNFTVLHQTSYSRRANIIGNILYRLSIGRACADRIFKKIIRENVSPEKILISTDPLISMIIPDEVILSSDTAIIHVVREAPDFACSMFNFTRKKRKSFMAHNFIPFWQPHLWPLENMLSNAIIDKYELIHAQKNNFFTKKYKKNINYQRISMNKIFSQQTLTQIIYNSWKLVISIPETELRAKTNQSIR